MIPGLFLLIAPPAPPVCTTPPRPPPRTPALLPCSAPPCPVCGAAVAMPLRHIPAPANYCPGFASTPRNFTKLQFRPRPLQLLESISTVAALPRRSADSRRPRTPCFGLLRELR